MRCLMLEFRRGGDDVWLCTEPAHITLRREADDTWSVIANSSLQFDGCESARDAGYTAAALLLDRWITDSRRGVKTVGADVYSRAIVRLSECDQAFESARLLSFVVKRIARLMDRLPEPFPASRAGGSLPMSAMDKFNVLSGMDDASWARWLAEIRTPGAPQATTVESREINA
jgi:hypothetical protein